MSATGKVVQVIGPVVDVEFPLDDKLPEINDALKIDKGDGTTLTTEVSLNWVTVWYGRLPWTVPMVCNVA